MDKKEKQNEEIIKGLKEIKEHLVKESKKKEKQQTKKYSRYYCGDFDAPFFESCNSI